MDDDRRLRLLEERVSRAEMRSRAFCILGFASLLCTLLLVGTQPAIGKTTGTTLRAPVKVLDGAGQVILELNASKDRPALELFDANGKAAVQLWSAPRSRGVVTCDRSGQRTAWMGANPSTDSGYLALYGPAIGVELLAHRHHSSLSLLGPGRSQATLKGDTGSGTIQLYDQKGNVLFKQGLFPIED